MCYIHFYCEVSWKKKIEKDKSGDLHKVAGLFAYKIVKSTALRHSTKLSQIYKRITLIEIGSLKTKFLERGMDIFEKL